MIDVIFCAYRDWANSVAETVLKHPNVRALTRCSSQLDLENELAFRIRTNEKNNLIVLFCGWSWPPRESIVNLGIPMFSEHPAASDRYSPGTPLQNQILDGIKRTKHRLVKVGYPELVLRSWSHEVEMDLSGNMSDILEQMTATSKVLFNRFLDDYPNVQWNVWDLVEQENQVPRRSPELSKIDASEFSSLSTERLYDRIRCLESPYPNAYIEDEHGCLFFEKVLYKKK